MLLAFISTALLTGWILSWFGFDGLLIEGLNQLFGVAIGIQGYYALFVIVAVIRLLIQLSKAQKNPINIDLKGLNNKLKK